MGAEHELGAAARQRMDALLPELLGTLRARMRRARRRRAFAALVLLAVPVLGWSLVGSAPTSTASNPSPVAPFAANGWSEVHDDAGVLARCEVVAVARASWFAGDDELQALLRLADRPSGLVRAGSRLFVPADAVDPWPAEAP